MFRLCGWEKKVILLKKCIFVCLFSSDTVKVRPWSCLSCPPTHPPPTHPPTTLSSEIEICTSDSLTPSNPYIFWKLVSRAIQKRQCDTNTKTMTITNTMTKTKTKTKTKRLKAALPTVPRPQTHTFSESSCQELFKDGNVTQIQRQWQLQIRRRRQRQRRGRQDNTWNTYSVLYFQNPDDSPSPAQHCPVQSSAAQYSLAPPSTV